MLQVNHPVTTDTFAGSNVVPIVAQPVECDGLFVCWQRFDSVIIVSNLSANVY